MCACIMINNNNNDGDDGHDVYNNNDSSSKELGHMWVGLGFKKGSFHLLIGGLW